MAHEAYSAADHVRALRTLGFKPAKGRFGREADLGDDPYATLEVALRHVATTAESETIAWLQRLDALLDGAVGSPPPGHILDLGCGAGIVATFIARKFPHSLVTAVDWLPGAARTTRALAKELELKNLTASVGEAGDMPGTLKAAGIVVDGGIQLLHLSAGPAGLVPPADTVAWAPIGARMPVEKDVVAQLASVVALVDGGRGWLVGAEVLPHADAWAWWSGTCIAAGWSPDWALTGRVPTQDSSMMALVARRRATSSPPPPTATDDAVAAWLAAHDGDATRELHGAHAEALLAVVGTSTMLARANFVAPDDSEMETREIRRAGAWQITISRRRTGGDLGVRIEPATALALDSGLAALTAPKADMGGWSVGLDGPYADRITPPAA